MSSLAESRRSQVAAGVYGLLNPIPFGCFVAALIFDILYAQTAVILWDKGAAWLIFFGLLFAVIPRVVNLAQIWVTSRGSATRADRFDFWFNFFAIIVAVVNAFVHSRDAYGVAPTGVWLSICTVLLIAIGNVMVAVQRTAQGRRR